MDGNHWSLKKVFFYSAVVLFGVGGLLSVFIWRSSGLAQATSKEIVMHHEEQKLSSLHESQLLEKQRLLEMQRLLDMQEEFTQYQKQSVDELEIRKGVGGEDYPRVASGVEFSASENPIGVEKMTEANAGFEADAALQAMSVGVVAYNAPEEINISDVAHIQLLLSLSDTSEQLMALLTEEGDRRSGDVKVSSRMEVTLTGSAFDIKPITPGVQAISRKEKTQWGWDVRPLEKGKHRLHITITAHVVVGGHDTARLIKVFDRDLEVSVTPAQVVSAFFSNNWQWLWGAIFIPVVGWGLSRKAAAGRQV